MKKWIALGQAIFYNLRCLHYSFGRGVPSMRRVLFKQYRGIWHILMANRLLVRFTFLVLVEVVVFHGFNTGGVQYANYVAGTETQYGCTFLFIFFENLKAAIFTIAVGIIPLFLGSLLAATSTMAAIISALKYLLLELPPHIIFLSVLLHGIFELPAILLSFFLSAILSKELTFFCLRRIGVAFKASTPIPICGDRNTAVMIVRCWLLVIMPLILAGAIVETFLSPLVVDSLLKSCS